MVEEKKEVDWKKAIGAAIVGDALDFFFDTGLLKTVGDFVDLIYTLPKMREALPEADKDIAYIAAFAETVPVIEALPNWGLLVAGSYIRKEVLGLGEKGPHELLGLPPLPKRGEGGGGGKKHETILESLGLPTPKELLALPKKKEERK